MFTPPCFSWLPRPRTFGSGAALLWAALSLLPGSVSAADVVALGDSLTAEYDVIPPIPGFPDLPTDYAKVTVPGWKAQSWVEILARLQPGNFNFGEYRPLSDSWSIPRLSGYEFNWAVPGINAGQYEDFTSATPVSNFAYWSLRQPLDAQLKDEAERVVIWLGGNDFRANYGPLYDGKDSGPLIAGIIDDLGRVIDYVKARNAHLQIVVGNLPDLGATPSKKAAHPDPLKRARVTAATQEANRQIAALAARKGVVVANLYALTARLVRNQPFYLGAVEFINDSDPDNNPRYLFTREGLHPNTAAQILNARSIIRAFNTGYGAGLPGITDAQALALLGINPRQPYFDWLNSYGLDKQGVQADRDADGMTNLVEYAFGLNPTLADRAQLPASLGGGVPGVTGNLSIRYRPDPVRERHVVVRAQYSSDRVSWKTVAPERVIENADGSFTAVIPPMGGTVYERLKVILRPPEGSSATQMSVVEIQ